MEAYFDWFHRHSQVELYSNGTTSTRSETKFPYMPARRTSKIIAPSAMAIPFKTSATQLTLHCQRKKSTATAISGTV
ncbi:MAG: hypothetical protein IPO07_27310 [Haliscomenobacter sp.]|nr:hypothetical protein [Haliscomenobacter sp.]MBK9492097.1 hypothetical protein [Haliscomenobacter sp.]